MGYISKSQQQVLRQIATTFDQYQIPYVIIGGLAAIAWGSKRQLVDIDILVSSENYLVLPEIFEQYLRAGPRHYTQNGWNIQQCVLDISGVTVDICDGDRMFLEKAGERHQLHSYIDQPALIDLDGNLLPIIPLDELIRYKRITAREVDLIDLRYLERRL